MKRLFSIFLLIATASMTVFAQDSPVSQEPGQTQTGYDYDGRAEVFVTGFGLLPRQATGNAISERATKAGGGSAGYRFHLNASSALEGRYGFSRNSQKYTINSAVSSIPVYLSEISGSYIYNFATSRRVQPFLEGGAGVMLFSPANYGGGTTASDGSDAANTFGYSPAVLLQTKLAVRSLRADSDPPSSDAVAAPVYGGSSAGPARQAKGMFVYGAGADVPVFSHLYFRIEFRAVGYKQPDFGAAALHTDAFTFVYEPSVGVTYRF
jgi:opacity protein-like surface antigen